MRRLAPLIASVVLSLVGCTVGNEFHAMDACPNAVFCDQLDEAFNVSGVYVTNSRLKVYCHMESGRWTEVLRRGEDAARTPVPEAESKSFATGEDPDPMITGFGDGATGEFYVGNAMLAKMISTLPTVPAPGPPPSVQLRVSLLGQDDVRYFSVFDGFSAYNDPLTLWVTSLTYRMGTAGDGKLSLLDGASYKATCTPTVWFSPSSTCDGTSDQGPVLTLPLVAENQRNGRTPWPTLPVELKAISLQLHTQLPTEACPGLEQHFAFDGDVLNSIEDTLPNFVGADDSFTISCKNSSWILPTKVNSADSIPSSVKFTCTGPNPIDNHPVVSGNPCMAPCPEGYMLYIHGTDTQAVADAPDRSTCLSPPSTEPAKSLVDAVARCGEKGEQLLDFVPAQRFIPAMDTAEPHWLWMTWQQQTDGLTTQVNSREETSGVMANTGNCMQVTYSSTPPTLAQTECHSDWLGSNPYKNFVCMTATGCGAGAVFHEGFCYRYISTGPATGHVAQCQTKGGTPADYTASFVTKALPLLNVPTDSPATPLVGIYKRYGKFWRPDGSVVPVTEFEGGTYGDDSLTCAALLPGEPTKLKAIDCATDIIHVGVICQTPGYATLLNEFCSVRYDQLLNASSSGPAPTLTRMSALDTTLKGDVVTFTCPDGYNVHNLTDAHSVDLTCRGFQEGWLYPATIPAELHGQPLECVFACDLNESVQPRNSEVVTIGTDSVFRCVGPLQTADGSTEQIAVCEHATNLVSGASQPCDQCIGSPLIPDQNATFESSWDSTTRLEGTTVNYTCLIGLQTPAGDTVQTQHCTVNGWEGEVEPCSQCVALEVDQQAALLSLSGPQPFGTLATVSCPDGLESGDGSLNTSVSCLPSGWDWCLVDFNCSYCTGSPPNVSAMATIDSDWDEALRQINTTVLYTCSSELETADGATEQTVNCTDSGWQGAVVPCDVCSNPPNGSHPTIGSTEETGDGTLGSSLKFVCGAGLSVADGFTSITSVCSETGWSHCSQDIKCEYCTPLPNLPDGTMSWGAYANETALGTEVTLTCNDGLAIAGSLQKTQTVVCSLDGWNHTDVKSCTVCDQEPPSSSMTLTWSLGDSQAEYQCPNDTMLPWGEKKYSMQCSPDGWADCVPECNACVFPPAAGQGVVITSQNVSRGSITRYECSAGLTSAGATELELTCTEAGWTEADMIVCDKCAGDPVEASPSQNRTGNVTGLIGSTLDYACLNEMTTADGLTDQNMTCSNTGWTEQPAPCDHCPLPAFDSFDNETQTSDLSANATDWVPVGTNITYLCSNVTTTLFSNSTSQMLSCNADGWSSELEPCVSCLGDIPDPGNGTDARNVTWEGGRQEGDVVLYTCQNGVQHVVNCTDREWTPALLGPCGTSAEERMQLWPRRPMKGGLQGRSTIGRMQDDTPPTALLVFPLLSEFRQQH